MGQVGGYPPEHRVLVRTTEGLKGPHVNHVLVRGPKPKLTGPLHVTTVEAHHPQPRRTDQPRQPSHTSPTPQQTDNPTPEKAPGVPTVLGQVGRGSIRPGLRPLRVWLFFGKGAGIALLFRFLPFHSC